MGDADKAIETLIKYVKLVRADGGMATEQKQNVQVKW